MVLKETKRKRKQIPVPVDDLLADKAKRTKVHAQRKFAQGQGASSYSVNNASSSSTGNPISGTTPATKEPSSSTSNSSKDNAVPPDQIMPDTPQAKDFLTYVCFNRNPIFQHLNYMGRPITTTSTATSSSLASSPLKNQPQTSPVKEKLAKPKMITESGKKSNPNTMPYTSSPASLVSRLETASSPLQNADLKDFSALPKAEQKKDENAAESRRTRSRAQEDPEMDIDKVLAEPESVSSSQIKRVGRKRRLNAKEEEADLVKTEENIQANSDPKPNTPCDFQQERVTRQKNIKSTSSYADHLKVQKVKDDDFSSDDDKPLMMNKLRTIVKAEGAKEETDKPKPAVEEDSVAKRNLRRLGGTSSCNSPVPLALRKTPQPSTKPSTPADVSRTDSQNSKELKRPGRKSRTREPDEVEAKAIEDSSKIENKVKRKYLSKELQKLTADISPSSVPVDLSETEARTSRPTRKTKEAATIYMELIGHKLNLHGSEDGDASSLDSFPELPNVKRTEKMENEHKQKVGKVKVEQRGQKPKKSANAEEIVLKESIPVQQANAIQLDKSFSDSDEEPLATKVTKRITTQVASSVIKESIESKDHSAPISLKPELKSSPKLNDTDELMNFSQTTFKSPQSLDIRSVGGLPASADQNRITEQNKQKQVVKDTWSDFKAANTSTNNNATEFLKPASKANPPAMPINLVKSQAVDDSSPQSIASLMMNPLPSKEESGKIFGIASVTLAQSSGPQDTKCTLGRCGSVHKPLGPAVPTEALLGECSTNKERRKSKVNMSQEQIQKWLIDCNATEKETIPDELSDFDCSASPKPGPFAAFSDINEEPSTSKKLSQNKMPITKVKNLIEKFDEEKEVVEDEVDKSVKKIIQKLNFEDDPPKAAIVVTKRQPKSEPIKVKSEKKQNPPEEKRATNSTASSLDQSPAIDKKPTIYNRKTPVYNKPVETPPPKLVKQNSFCAFSPENEHSDVYSFDKEEDVTPIRAPPFRRHSRMSNAEENSPKNVKKEKKSVTSTPTKDGEQEVSLSLSPTSGAMQVSLNAKEKRTQRSTVDSKKNQPSLKASQNTEGNDSDSEGHTIYIPLQGSNNQSGKNDQMIQGVSVKLGTEGPDGCVIMKAKLVTKAPGIPSSSLSDVKAQEIMKTLMSSKDITSLKPVPVGTVQPRFKSNEPNTSGSNLMRTGSNSSLISQKSKLSKATLKNDTPIQPSNNTAFPRVDDPAQMVEAPIFRPTEKEFQDPLEFIERITPIAARFGLCRIIPPSSFKPECRVADDMRFTAYNQYVHKMLHRWGPSTKELSAIRKYLTTQSISLAQPPWIGGMEVDLPRLYHTVQELGGLKEVIEKKKWARVAEEMCIPKSAQERVTKLDDIYCKFLLPYDTLSHTERQKLFDEVEADWAKREAKARRNADRRIDESDDENMSSSDEEEDEDEDDNQMECIIKGRSMPLNAFFRIARNTMALWFKNTEPVSAEVESEFWRHVAVRDSHVCVHSGSIDSSGWGYGFPAPGTKSKTAPGAKHPWNLKILTNNSSSVLRSLGPVMGVTVPTLHVGMLFSACCYYRDPHGLPWIEYLHTGSSKIWYGVPDEQSHNFRSALTSLVPTHCQNKTIWLPCDTAMVPPHLLTDKGVSLCRTEQQPGHFVVIFPRAYTSSISTGYVVSESVYFATNSWLETAHQDFNDIQESCEPTMFSLEQLIFAIVSDQRSNIETLCQVEPMLKNVYEREKEYRNSIKDLGVRFERAKKGQNQTKAASAAAASTSKKAAASQQVMEEESECDLCRANLFISMLRTETEDEEAFYCLQHGLMYLKKGELQAAESKLIWNYDLNEIEALIRKLSDRIVGLQHQKKSK